MIRFYIYAKINQQKNSDLFTLYFYIDLQSSAYNLYASINFHKI